MKKNFKISRERCLNYRRKILDISQKVSALHLGGAFSALEMVDYIYYELLEKKFPKSKFIMSKGHGCMAQYVVLNSLGIIKDKDLDEYCTENGILGCHPDYGNPGIFASTGSLGHGMGLCAGIAHAYKIKKNDKKIITILSDGELQEGSTWESLMMASNLKLDNLIIFIDHNGSQSFGHTIETHPSFYPIEEKLKSFVCDVEVVNGHNVKEIDDVIDKFNMKNNRPKIIFANTVKGKGVSFIENKPIWHYRSPNNEEYKIAINNLKEVEN